MCICRPISGSRYWSSVRFVWRSLTGKTYDWQAILVKCLKYESDKSLPIHCLFAGSNAGPLLANYRLLIVPLMLVILMAAGTGHMRLFVG